MLIQQAFSQTNVKIARKDYVIPAFVKVPAIGEYEGDLKLLGISSGILHYNQIKNSEKDYFEQLGLLQPIQNSLYDVEIRLYHSSPFFSGNVIVVKGNSKKLIAESYSFSKTKQKKLYRMKKNNGLPFYYIHRKLSVPDTLFTSLIKNKIFNYDPVAVRDSLKKVGKETRVKEIMDYSNPSFLIKVKNNYYHFSCDVYASEVNKGLTEVAPESILTNTFYSLAKEPKK